MEEIVIALIRKQDGSYLITRRFENVHQGGLWEFPGGKIEEGETLEEAAKREVMEELGIEIELGDQLESIEHTYSDKTVRLHPIFAKMVALAKPVPLGCEEFTWVPPEKLYWYDFPAANSSLIRKLTPEGVHGKKNPRIR